VHKDDAIFEFSDKNPIRIGPECIFLRSRLKMGHPIKHSYVKLNQQKHYELENIRI